MIGLEHTWIITVKRHEEKYDQKNSKNFKKKVAKKTKSNNFWNRFFAVKRHLIWTYWWKIYDWSWTYLNNHCENAWRKIWPKKFKKFQKKSCEKKLSLTISEIRFFAVKRHLIWTHWWKIYDWSWTYLNNHCENAWRKIWPKKFKKFQKKSCEKKLSLTISEIAFSL